MTDTDTPGVLTVDDAIAQVSAVLDQLRAVAAAPRAVVNPDGTPGNVAAGELIESAWGNATADTIKHLLIPNHINADGNPWGQLKMETGRVSGITDTNGFVAVTFQTAFTLPYSITASNVKWPEDHVAAPLNPSGTGFTMSIRLISTGAPAANVACDACWIAIGRRP